MASCSVEGCERAHSCRGFCDMHYKRWRRHGDPTAIGTSGRPPTIKLGDLFGRLTVIGPHDRDARRRLVYLCRCACGTETPVRAVSLQSGDTRSCGCLSRESAAARAFKHGHARSRDGRVSPTYKTWQGMRQRCSNPRSHKWGQYGGRGIAVCERWQRFENFLADMGERPDGATIDRIDPDGDYEPGNCRWATSTVQNRNRRRGHRGPKLTLAVARQIRAAHACGATIGCLADEHGVTRATIHAVLSGRTWREQR